MHTQMKCAIFDLDGTVLDSTDVWNQIDAVFFAERQIELPEDYAKTIAPMGFYKAAVYTVETFGLDETPDEVVRVWNGMAQAAFARDVGLKPNVKPYLEQLRSQNIRLCIATASHPELFVPALERNGVMELFDKITTITEVRRGKGFPDIYWKAAESVQTPVADCVVFEDILEGVRGAKDGGFYTVGVYDKNARADTEKIKTASDRFIYDYAELL